MNVFAHPSRLRHTRSTALVLGAALLMSVVLASAQETPAAAETGDSPGAETAPPSNSRKVDIKADRMQVDFAARVAKFEGNVKVSEPQMTLEAERLLAYFSESQRLKRVIAMGQVVIVQANTRRKVEAGHAEYDIDKGEIVLTEETAISMGPDQKLVGAERIVYRIFERRLETEGGSPHIVFVTESTGTGIPNPFETDDDKPDNDAGEAP
jgi:lipopolysaccharide transport protein LptA